MDAFFAAIEERDNPQLRGLPVVVGADPRGGKGRGVVSTANYRAREYGIQSAMPISRAWRLSEVARHRGKSPAVFVRVNWQRYAEVSSRVMGILRRHVPRVEEASIDEAYMDLTFTGSLEKAKRLCETIKKEIRDSEQLTASVGIGPNKLIAKIASGTRKPDGLTLVAEESTTAFLANLPIRIIPGIGPKTEVLLRERGVKIVRDLRKFTRGELQALLGRWGFDLYEKVRGRDESPVVEAYEAKSIGEQETFLEDTDAPAFVSERLRTLCQNVFERFRDSGFGGFRTVVITVRFADFETKTRSHTLREGVATREVLETEAFQLFQPFLDSRENPKRKKFRLVGVRIEKLMSAPDLEQQPPSHSGSPSTGNEASNP
jgi:DNA polymerase IV (DinB-like DNA polymerase)